MVWQLSKESGRGYRSVLLAPLQSTQCAADSAIDFPASATAVSVRATRNDSGTVADIVSQNHIQIE